MNKFDDAMMHLNEASRILKEDYGVIPQPEEEEIPMEEVPQKENLARNDDRIAQIREVALEGLQDYAHDVDGEEYQFFKKIWLMCDKAVSEKESADSDVR